MIQDVGAENFLLPGRRHNALRKIDPAAHGDTVNACEKTDYKDHPQTDSCFNGRKNI